MTIEPVAGQMPSLDVLKLWIDESYRAQAPKKLAAIYAGSVGPSRAKKTAHARSGKRDGRKA